MLMKFVCSMAWADLEVVAPEREAMRSLMQKVGLDDAEHKRLVELWLQVPPPVDDLDPHAIPLDQRELFLRECQTMVEADGVVVDEERDAMELLRAILGCD
jgi:uncharacterized tellurite resistance protein B-like protein